MTVSSMANSYYNIYKFSTNQVKKINAVALSKISKSDYVTDLTNSINLIKLSTDKKNSSIVSLDSFVKNTFTLSKSTNYNANNVIKNGSIGIFNGNINNNISMAFIMDRMNVTSDTTNINSILNHISAAQFINLKNNTTLQTALSNKKVNSYTYYLGTTAIGSLFNEIV
jgi:hypothetical protein